MQNTGELMLTIYMLYDMFLRKELPFGGQDDCTCIKMFCGINF